MNRQPEYPAFLDDLRDQLTRVAQQESARSRTTRRVSMTPRSIMLTCAATLLLAGGAGAATGVVPIPGGGPDFVAQDTRGSFSPELKERVAVLARARTDADSMGSAATFVGGSDSPAPASSLRVNPPPPRDTSHATATTLPIWLVPTASGAANMVILPPGADGPASGFAADLAMVESGRAWMTLGHDLAGLAPNGVATATVTLNDGTQVDLPVEDNVFGARFDTSVRAVSFD